MKEDKLDYTYLIPANSKKGLLIMGLFNPKDLIIFGTGIVSTVIMLLIFNSSVLWQLILILLPALITGLLVMPVPNYHNSLTVITSAIVFFTKRQKFKWKGWCFYEKVGYKK